jgi:hypothetical protein
MQVEAFVPGPARCRSGPVDRPLRRSRSAATSSFAGRWRWPISRSRRPKGRFRRGVSSRSGRAKRAQWRIEQRGSGNGGDWPACRQSGGAECRTSRARREGTTSAELRRDGKAVSAPAALPRRVRAMALAGRRPLRSKGSCGPSMGLQGKEGQRGRSAGDKRASRGGLRWLARLQSEPGFWG